MKKTLIILSLLFLIPFQAFAFQSVDSDAFKQSSKFSFFKKIWQCKLSISCYRGGLGAFTEVASTDTLTNFPTTYNANLARTVEVGTTSVASITTLAGLTSASTLATIGTITTGVWNGTVIGVAFNGTGSTSPTLNQVILGNGSSGFKVVSGFGNSGQFLTSGGAATAPTWTTSAIDLAANYTWTGLHAFTASTSLSATTTIAANSVTNRALILNNIPYAWPSSQGAASTTLVNNGSGVLTNVSLPWLKIAEGAFAGQSTTTLSFATSTSKDLKVIIEINGVSIAAGAGVLYMQLDGDVAANYGATFSVNGGAATQVNTSQLIQLTGASVSTGANAYGVFHISNTLAQPKFITGSVQATAAPNGPNSLEVGGVWNNTDKNIGSITIGMGCSSGSPCTPTAGRISVYASQN